MNKERLEVSKEWLDVFTLLFATSERAPFDFAGIPVYTNQHLPMDTAIMFDSEGNIAKIFKLEAV